MPSPRSHTSTTITPNTSTTDPPSATRPAPIFSPAGAVPLPLDLLDPPLEPVEPVPVFPAPAAVLVGEPLTPGALQNSCSWLGVIWSAVSTHWKQASESVEMALQMHVRSYRLHCSNALYAAESVEEVHYGWHVPSSGGEGPPSLGLVLPLVGMLPVGLDPCIGLPVVPPPAHSAS
ncbi:hypothetical protein CALCODRAFT_492828 [Calocera cornea HHB12733]|uniref:Uncharacterized protein n=1 Tax=Calocera cornea HHB12733 TaxID=1353952 RepID=A0A165I2S8_9BASI|nr:hypothetical protein CALCODRAFT_492828 [Calocera cornea HHB12733]